MTQLEILELAMCELEKQWDFWYDVLCANLDLLFAQDSFSEWSEKRCFLSEAIRLEALKN